MRAARRVVHRRPPDRRHLLRHAERQAVRLGGRGGVVARDQRRPATDRLRKGGRRGRGQGELVSGNDGGGGMMPITVALPGALQPYAEGNPEVTLAGGCTSVGEVLCALAGRYAGVVDRVMDEQGRVRQHVNVFVDGDNIRFLDGLATPVGQGSTVTIVPAVSGG